VQGAGCRVQGSGFRGPDSGFKEYGPSEDAVPGVSVGHWERRGCASPQDICRQRHYDDIYSCRANSEHIKQSRPDSGLGLSRFRQTSLQPFALFPSRSAAAQDICLTESPVLRPTRPTSTTPPNRSAKGASASVQDVCRAETPCSHLAFEK